MMNKTVPPLALGLAAALFAGLAHAGADELMAQRKPGLWEIQSNASGSTIDAANQQMQAALANMPPERRAQVEAMMKQHGAQAGRMGNMNFRHCLTAEDIAKHSFNKPEPDADCSQQITQTSATEVAFKFSCKRKDGSAEQGQGRAWNITPTSYQLSLQMSGTERNGKPMDMKVEQKAHWVGSDCKGAKY